MNLKYKNAEKKNVMDYSWINELQSKSRTVLINHAEDLRQQRAKQEQAGSKHRSWTIRSSHIPDKPVNHVNVKKKPIVYSTM